MSNDSQNQINADLAELKAKILEMTSPESSISMIKNIIIFDLLFLMPRKTAQFFCENPDLLPPPHDSDYFKRWVERMLDSINSNQSSLGDKLTIRPDLINKFLRGKQDLAVDHKQRIKTYLLEQLWSLIRTLDSQDDAA